MSKKKELCHSELQALVDKLEKNYYVLTADTIKSIMHNDMENAMANLKKLESHLQSPHEEEKT